MKSNAPMGNRSTGMNECSKCFKIKKLEDFEKRGDGRRKVCKACRMAYVKKYRRETGFWRSDKYKARFRKDGKTTYENRKVSLEKYAEKHPERLKARAAVAIAIKIGALKKLPCAVCGEKKVHAHHYVGYAKKNWLVISWLCNLHHNQSHYGK